MASPFPFKTPIPETATIFLALIDAPLVPRVDKRKGKKSTSTTSSAAKRRRTQISSPSQGAGEDSYTGQSDEVVLDSAANLSPLVKECRAVFPTGLSTFHYPLEGKAPLEALYQQHEVDTVSVQLHSSLVGQFGENMRVVIIFLLFL